MCVCAQLKRNYISAHRGAAKTIPCLVIRTYTVLKALECGLEFSNRSEILDSDWNDAKMLFPSHTPWEGYLPVKSIGGLPLKGPITRSFDVFPVVISSKVLIKQLSCQWFSIPWRSRDGTVIKNSSQTAMEVFFLWFYICAYHKLIVLEVISE